MIFKMARDIALFLVVFCVFLFGFAYAFFTLQLEGFKTFLDASTSVFQISLGDWDWDAIYEGGPVAIILFISYSIIGPIMLLNLLIAVRISYLFTCISRLIIDVDDGQDV